MSKVMAIGIVRSHPHCCGARDYEGFNQLKFTPARAIKKMIQGVPSYQTPHAGMDSYCGTGFFNMVACASKYGMSMRKAKSRVRAFTEYVEKNKLGTVVVSEPVGNPNYSGSHVLFPMMFIPDNVAMRTLGIKRKYIKDTRPKKKLTAYQRALEQAGFAVLS